MYTVSSHRLWLTLQGCHGTSCCRQKLSHVSPGEMTPCLARSRLYRRAAMPTLAFLAAVGIALIALLCVADATLERSSPVIPTSDRIGLPERWHSNTIQILTSAPAPAPDMTSPAVLAAQPRSEPDILDKIGPAARAARAETSPTNNLVTRPTGRRQNNDQTNQLADRFSIKGQ